MDLKTFRSDWSEKQKRLRGLFQSGAEDAARALLASQHQVFHSKKATGSAGWSYADQIFSGLSAEDYRIVPGNQEHSLTWVLWHISRIEDITMNILVAGRDQIYLRDGWKKKLGSPFDHTGNAAPAGAVQEISQALRPETLHTYRNAVCSGSRFIFQETPASVWGERVLAERLERLVAEGAVLPEADEVLAYWGKRKIFELFLMPPTRHLMSHLNEAMRIRERIIKQAGN